MNFAVRDIPRRAYSTRTQHIELRLATPEDAAAIARLLGSFFARTIWADCLDFDVDKATANIERGIAHSTQPCILAVEHAPKIFHSLERDRKEIQELNLAGCVSWHIDARFTDPIGVLDEVYVVPRLRRSDLGRRLIMLAVHIGKTEGAKVFNFPIASGMPEQTSLVNMLVRHIGAEPVGMILRKVL